MAVYNDKRLYHVPARYASFAEMSPSVVLQEMRQKLVEQFQTISVGGGGEGAGSSAEAKTLQNFFQQIKQMTSKTGSMQSEGGQLSRALMWQVITKAEALGGYHQNREWFKMWGGQVQGVQFERELANIVAAVANMTGANTTGSKLMTGSGSLGAVNLAGAGSKADLTGALDTVVQEWLKSTDERLRKLAQDMMKNSNQLVTIGVSGKIDVTALTAEYNFVATGNAEFDHVARLLKTATFTAKSYASLKKEYLEALETLSITEGNRNELHLGSTSSKRIYIDMLMKFGDLPYPVAASFYYRTMHSRGRKPMDDLNRLRWIYELTGYGQTYLTDWFQQRIAAESGMGAKYLIYNDPSTNNIYVKSTAELVVDVMADFAKMIKNGTSVIGKSWFK